MAPAAYWPDFSALVDARKVRLTREVQAMIVEELLERDATGEDPLLRVVE